MSSWQFWLLMFCMARNAPEPDGLDAIISIGSFIMIFVSLFV